MVTQMQKEMSAVLEGQYQNLSQKASEAIEEGSQKAPVGGDVLASAMQSVLDASSKALNNINSASKQISDTVQENVQAAGEVAKKSSKAAGSAGKAVSRKPAGAAAKRSSAAKK